MNNRVFVVACVVLAACTEKEARGVDVPAATPVPAAQPEPPAPSDAPRLVEAGPLQDEAITFEFAVYFLGPAPKNPGTTAAKLAKKFAPTITIVDTPKKDDVGPAMYFSTPVIKDYAPPSSRDLKYFARGLSPEQLKKTPGASGAFIVSAIAPASKADETHRALLALMHALATEWKAVIWDEETREAFSAEFWAEHRLTWKSGPPDITDHITIHQYVDGELLRLISLGMSKFGLPDVVANDVSESSARSVGLLMNLTMQTLVEHPELAANGKLPVDITALKNADARAQFDDLLENAEKKATLDVAWSEPEDGDPENRLLELVFASPGETAQEGQHRITALVFGNQDDIFNVDHDNEELQAAHERALAAFLKLKSTFKKKKTRLQVKAPFTTDDGNREWMWVDVTDWSGTKVRGILANEPYAVSKLKMGARVEFEEGSVFDYLLTKADGSTEGGETNDIIERLGR